LSTTVKNRVLSGMRPTGRLHIGHYFGALQNWVRLQADPSYECFFCVVDWHALTTDYADTSAVAENSLQITIDFLASGLDPAKSTIFLQSLVPEHAELHLLLSMVTPLGWLERIPTYKEQLENIRNKDLHTYGFLGYPVLQAADIAVYSEAGKGLVVPVGEDQVSHVEFSREVVRKFDNHFGLTIDPAIFKAPEGTKKKPILELSFHIREDLNSIDPEGTNLASISLTETEWESLIRSHAMKVGVANFLDSLPEKLRAFFSFTEILIEPGHLLTHTPRIPGLDGRKMSKSYGNTIILSESDEDIRRKTKVMVTDPARKRRTDPGNPDVCPVYDWHKLFSTPERDPGRLDWVRQGCTTAGIGCIECKAAMAENLIQWIAPVREKRLEYEQRPRRALEILDAGSAKARESAKRTMERVREAIFHWRQKRASLQ
jgi:tryptophanyl-tRNA synthetase